MRSLSYKIHQLNEAYDAHLRLLATRAHSAPSPINQDDHLTKFRTTFVLFWVFCNSVLVAVVLTVPGLSTIDTQPTGIRSQSSIIYMAVVFWSVAAVIATEFLGAVSFRILSIFL
jgi:chitin synthase